MRHQKAMTSIRHILAATDFSPASDRAVETASDLAAAFGAELTIVHVAEPPPYQYPVPPPIGLFRSMRGCAE
jgi:nucleotide-binding universal stress UspA family protein